MGRYTKRRIYILFRFTDLLNTMAISFNLLPVARVVKETDNAVSIALDVPLSLKQEFQYKQGQYLTFKIQSNGESYRRAYSLCSSPVVDDYPTVTVKRVERGVVSNIMNDKIKAGDTLEVMPPLGNFTVALDSDQKKRYVLFGGGSGITPLMSILKTVLAVEPQSSVILAYANRDESSIIFNRALADLEAQYPERLKIVHILSQPSATWSGLRGRIDKRVAGELLERYVGPDTPDTEYMVCGPSGLMEQVQLALGERGIPTERLHREYFDAPLPGPGAAESIISGESSESEGDASIPHEVTLIMYGARQAITVQPDQSVLEAAIDAGADPPFACQVGACCTCRAKLTSGKVTMDDREALTDEEIDEGYILTCQSHPLTADCVVDYDQ